MKKFMGKTMAKMNENRRNGRKALKGFTLVEIIVVLVILAILAAAMIPALTGYIDMQGRGQQLLKQEMFLQQLRHWQVKSMVYMERKMKLQQHG